MTDKLRGGNTFAYACDRYMDTVYRVAVHNTRTTADAEDVTQEVFEKLITSGRQFRDEEHLKAWLIRVTLNRCKNLHRAQSRETGLLSDALYVPPPDSAGVLEEVRALPPNYRNAIYLHYYEGYSASEIAGLMGSGINTVLSWLSRGRKALKARMIGGFDDEE